MLQPQLLPGDRIFNALSTNNVIANSINYKLHGSHNSKNKIFELVFLKLGCNKSILNKTKKIIFDSEFEKKQNLTKEELMKILNEPFAFEFCIFKNTNVLNFNIF